MLDQFICQRHRRADIFLGHVVLLLDNLETSAGGHFGKDAGHRHASSPNNRLAVMNSGIDLNALLHDINSSITNKKSSDIVVRNRFNLPMLATRPSTVRPD